jgi:agmatine deiminase
MLNRRNAVKTIAASFLAGSFGAAASAVGRSAKAAGYHMPLESVPHLRTFMQWPAVKSIYSSQDGLDAVREKIALIANSIAKFEPVVVLARPEQAEEAKTCLKNGVDIWPMAVQDLWCRDSGPTFVVKAEGKLATSELNFNGWGEKQQNEDDAQIARSVSEKIGLPVFENAVKGEGGGVEILSMARRRASTSSSVV